jgi:hypothetical protein
VGGDEPDDADLLGRGDRLGVWLVRSTRRTPTKPESAISERTTATDGAQRLLAERFARGEIDETEFTRSRTLLGTSPTKETSR